MSRIRLLMVLCLVVAAGPAGAQPTGVQTGPQTTRPATQADASPALRALSEGTLPIVACPEDPDRGCVEVLFDGPQPPVSCWTLPPFGTAAVRVEASPAQPVADGSTTRRMTIRFYPLREVPPATPATLHFGFARPGAPLACDQTLVVQRPPGVLDLPGELNLGTIHVDLWGRVSGSALRRALFPAAGQPPVGPITLSSGTDLHAAGRRGSPVPIRMDLPADAVVTANRFAEMTVAAGSTSAFPALGPLSGQALLTAPQLVQPLALTIRADSRIGWITVLATLVAGIGAGALVHRRILPRQALARARLDAERSAIAADRLRDRERDDALVKSLDGIIGKQRDAIRAATDPAAIAKAVAQLDTEVTARLQKADTQRQALVAAVAPARAALRTLPAVSELPEAELDAWSDVLDTAQALIDDGEIARPDGLLKNDIPPRQRAAMQALADFAGGAGAALRELDRWTRDPAKKAFAPLQAVAPQFDLPADPVPVDTLIALRDAQHALRRAVAANRPAIAALLRDLARGAGHAQFPNAAQRTDAILTDLDRRPVAALTELAVLVRDYDDYAKAKGGASFEVLADFKGGLERGPAAPAPVEADGIPPEEPPLAIDTEPRLPVAGQDVTIRLLGLGADRTARIWTPLGAARIAPGGDPVLTVRPPHPGPLLVETVTGDAQGRVLSRQSLTLTIRPAADHAIPALTAEVRRSDNAAVAAAAVIALLSGAAVFSVVPLTSWWGLLAPLLWGFFVNLNLPAAIEGLQARRDAVFKTLNIS